MIVLFGSEKGGTGKTTAATNMAAMRAKAGRDTLLVDTDGQESATIWSQVRSDLDVQPPITCVFKRGKLGADLLALSEKFDTVIVDAGGRDSVELRQAMAVCDRMIIPVRPSQFDSWSLDKMAILLKEIEERVGRRPPAAVVLNAVSTNPQVREAAEVRESLAEQADILPVLATELSDRVSFRRAAREGKSVIELTGSLADPKGSAELMSLYQEVFNAKFAIAKKAA